MKLNQNKKVCVLLALYNGEKFIEQQLQSLLDQTYPIEKLYIGDDGSTDSSKDIIKRFISKHKLEKKWFLYENEKNLGHAGNFIHLCKYVTGDYVFFCDQDDIWMPEKIEQMVCQMENNPQIQFLYADVIDTIHPENRPSVERKNILPDHIPFTYENYFFKGLGCSTCVRTNFITTHVQYWTEGWEHDMFFWACAILTGSGYYLQTPVIWRRLHANNASICDKKTYTKRKKQVEMTLNRISQLERLLHDESITSEDILNFICGYKKVLSRREKAFLTNNPFLAAMNLFHNNTLFFLHKKKGVILDIVLIIFRKYPFW